VQKLAFGPDGTFLITASADGVSRIWNASSGEPVAQINGHESDIAAVVLGPAYALAATLSSQGVLRLWRLDGPRGALAATIRLDEDLIEATTFSPDGNWLLGRTRSGRWHRWLAEPSALAQQYPWLAGLSRAEQDELGPGR
jgi:WD40 repeat protein